METFLICYYLQAEISPTVLRLVASQYVSSTELGKVNYEKVLGYISTTLMASDSAAAAEAQESPRTQQNRLKERLQQQYEQEQKQQQQNSLEKRLQEQYQQQQVNQAEPSPRSVFLLDPALNYLCLIPFAILYKIVSSPPESWMQMTSLACSITHWRTKMKTMGKCITSYVLVASTKSSKWKLLCTIKHLTL